MKRRETKKKKMGGKMSNQELSKKLKECSNVKEMFDLLSKVYDLEKCVPGPLVKQTFSTGILTGIALLKPPLKK